MKILFLGDIVGRLGREGVKKALPELKKKYDPDLTVANAENLAHGLGATKNTLEEMKEAGIDIFTSGNHIWDKKDIYEVFKIKDFPLLRPANYPPGVEGKGYMAVEVGSKKVLIVNLLGRVFIKEDCDCPFRKMDEILEENKDADIVFVDLHAEATSEKYGLANYLDGRVNFLVGTHTHAQTADEKALPNGTAFISDAGMCGAKDSIIGADKGAILKSFLTQISYGTLPEAEGPCIINGVVCFAENNSNRIKRINEEV